MSCRAAAGPSSRSRGQFVIVEKCSRLRLVIDIQPEYVRPPVVAGHAEGPARGAGRLNVYVGVENSLRPAQVSVVRDFGTIFGVS
jgi:hypothetical protein